MKRFKGGERWLQEREAFNKQIWGQRWVGKAYGVRWSSVDCSNDRKSAGKKKDNVWEIITEHLVMSKK